LASDFVLAAGFCAGAGFSAGAGSAWAKAEVAAEAISTPKINLFTVRPSSQRAAVGYGQA
jgi:hypothetical protein